MAAGVVLGRGGEQRGMESRRRRAGELRAEALRLAGEDAAAYRAVMDAPPERRGEALAAAAGPPLAIAEAAAETGELAASLSAEVNGPLRGEAKTAMLLAAAATGAAAYLVELNLAREAADPRLARARELAERAGARS
jgi:formiminotetrahydrofolate cyclodeaminase